MPALRKSVPLIIALALLSQAGGVRAEVRRPGVAGRVLGESNPLAAAHLYAYQLADLSLHKAMTDGQGNFLFQDLPAGLYKIIAHKVGFMPAVIMLTRTTAQAYQYLDVQLAQKPAGKGRQKEQQEDDFWAIRARVPADVLHDIEVAEAGGERVQLASAFRSNTHQALQVPSSFKGEMNALTGVDQIADGGGQMSGAGLGVQGQLGQLQVGVTGRFFQLSPDATFQPAGGGAAGTGQTSSLAIDLQHGPSSRVSIQSFNNRMVTRSESGREAPVDFEHYQVNWSQDVGENGRSEFAAHYTSENNFHRQAAIGPMDIPEASRSWKVEGAFTENFSDRSTLQTGLRYRDRQFGLGDATGLSGLGSSKADARQQDLASVDLFSRGGYRMQPAVLMEYGLYSTLSDGSLALTPQGGLVLQLGSDWQLETSAAHRVYRNQPVVPDFLPTLFAQRDLCEQGSESCYQMNLTRKVGDDSLTVGAVQHKVGDTLRLYFSEDFFDRAESLYLVRGDKLPELRLGFTHKLSPKVVTKLESSAGSGGGGVFIAADGQAYQNRVRYLVTSLDTKFAATSTGVFIAFRHLEQQLDPAGDPAGRSAAQMDFQRLQLAVNQNLNFLLNLASDWAVQINMELSRGLDPTTGVASATIRRRILGGIAVKF
ncbi:MAG TPA: carboxypeptidase-like regulatory domain-containing protein [Thermoanaerobaculia bacterium]|jgi:hypothetical protein